MSMLTNAGLSPVLVELDELVGHLTASRERAARMFAAEMFFFEQVAGIVERREAERAAADEGAITRSSQLGMREVFAEIGAALKLSEWQVARKVSSAWTLMHQFHETLCDASCGVFSGEHAALIADAGAVIENATIRAEFERIARELAAELTPGQLKAALAGLVQRLDPEGCERRVRDAVARRKVTAREVEPGLTRITADVPTAQGAGIIDRIRAMATELHDQNTTVKADAEAAAADVAAQKAAAEKAAADAAATDDAAAKADGAEAAGAEADGAEAAGAGTAEASADADAEDVDAEDVDADAVVFDERTHTQIMADIFCDLLLTGNTHGHGTTEAGRDAINSITPTVQVTIPATTLAGATVGGAAVDGFGPIDDTTAKHLAGVAKAWVRVFTDPCSGIPISVDRYRPSKKQKLFLQVRDRHCRFPGCRRPAQTCDIDHTIPYAQGGPTCLCNLEHFCKRHHTVKHDTAWTVEQLSGGILRFTAPTRRVHTTRPPGTVRFTPIQLIDPDPHLKHQFAQQLADDPAPY
ncbi:HNH endonuclease signature motif containing protein [Microbacterium terrisoli]|uniref:HNH endonuclease signature motif containing protein n=1 Tax=Microbacterium terrisoli TaxID=3242192 RepID=UPI002803D340|nr:DUF222 domain-containing protein [Microbacterium protaetiae]